MSLGNMDVPENDSFPAVLVEQNRRQSFSSPLDAIGGGNEANSGGTMATAPLQEDNPFALEPPKHASRFDPKAALHARTVSNASLGSRILLENDGASVATGVTGQRRDRPYSTVELLRPKILVMPSPLQSANNGTAPPPVNRAQDGFEISTDGPPLPPGARTVRPTSIAMLGSSSSLLLPLTLSQLTFRNELMVGGQRDVSYADLDRNLPRATQEGEQINTALPDQAPDLPLPLRTLPRRVDQLANCMVPVSLTNSRVGKYKCEANNGMQLRARLILMSDRKSTRVFTGDQRPSMMARGQVRSSTLIDPATLQPPPNRSSAFGMPPTSPHSQSLIPHNLARSSTLIDPATLAAPPARASTFGIPETSPQNLTRRNSSMKPLLNFDDDAQPRESKTLNSRSVFGVDTLWEREMAKLKEIEEQEKLEAAARELEESKLADKKSKKKGKKKGKGQETPEETPTSTPVIGQEEAVPRVSAEPPILPDIPKAVRRPPRPRTTTRRARRATTTGSPRRQAQ
ncbi:Hsp90 protein-domain-containing protein [Salix suchowensis]|nr:Hsp90 protein-domain-containing protein [Salix suchowensis]